MIIKNDDFILALYRSGKSVFKVADIPKLMPTVNPNSLSERLRYYVKTNRLVKLRRDIYAKPNYDPLELANTLFTPSYISLEYVLQRAGVIFQFGTKYTLVSYLSRELEIGQQVYSFRRIKPEIITHPKGILHNEGNYNQALPERAFLDLLYLDKSFYFDRLESLDKEKIESILPIYKTRALEQRVHELLKND